MEDFCTILFIKNDLDNVVFCEYLKEIMRKEQIAKLRERLGWTQPQMSEALGLANRVTIAHWENATRVPTATALRLLQLLNELPKAELEKITKRLVRLGMEKSREKK